jgi:hypothetical protein
VTEYTNERATYAGGQSVDHSLNLQPPRASADLWVCQEVRSIMKAFLVSVLVLAFPWMAVAQIASLRITALEGEGATHPAGAHISRPLTVQVTDDLGQPVAGAAVSFQLPPEGPSGVFSNGLRTDLAITDTAGRATIQSIQLNRASGQCAIRITAVKQLTRDLGEGLHAVVQARGATVVFQYTDEDRPTRVAPAEPAPISTLSPEAAAGAPSAERSADITPTAAKMEPRSSKKWIVLAAIVAACAGAAAAVAVSRATGSKPSSTGPGSTATIGAPTITIGNP